MTVHQSSFPGRAATNGLSPEQLKLLQEPIRIPPGYGLRMVPAVERAKRLTTEFLGDAPAPMDTLLVWEPPRPRTHLYVVSADISNGLGLDQSVIDVTRVGTVRECDEQVAQFVTNSIDETDLAYVIDAVGRFYSGRDGQAAIVGIECNGMGLSTQNELMKHIGYTNVYIWQYLDAVDGHEFTTRYGWYTNQRSRPLILQRYMHNVKSVDPTSGYPDYRINSPHTIHELADFQSPGALWMAEAVDGAHDDCIMAGAIGVFIAQTLNYNQRETVHDARRRIGQEAARAARLQDLTDRQVSFQSTDASYDSMMGREFDAYGEPVDVGGSAGDDGVDHFI